jgi:hypothetical protein
MFSLGQSDTQSAQNISLAKEMKIETECDMLLSIVSVKKKVLNNKS